jgi:heterodisulfide reductase subunit C
MDHTPRRLFALIRAGQMEEVLESNTPWYCVSCYLCTVRCPQDIHITDIMYTLKRMAIQKGLASENKAVDLSETFIGYMEDSGRSFEFGLATRHYLRHRPMSIAQTATMGLGMLSQGRMEMTRTKIENLGQFQAIVRRAKELEAQS